MNGSLCSNNSFLNKACVSVTVCTPGTATCQTINDIVLDTESFGLRIFKQALNVSLVQVSSGSGLLAECIQFADGSSDWGPVQTASIILGNEPAVQVPIQVIDSTFGPPQPMRNPRSQPLGRRIQWDPGGRALCPRLRPGVRKQHQQREVLQLQRESNCTGTAVALDSQVQNPVALLPQDNNGVIVQLPSVPVGGSPSVNGSLVLGIGTQSNNMPSGVTAYTVDPFGEFSTTFNGTSYLGFIDSGSNGLFFPTTLLPNCPLPIRSGSALVHSETFRYQHGSVRLTQYRGFISDRQLRQPPQFVQ